MADSLPPCLPISESSVRRYHKLVEAFKQKYDCQPDFVARAPGRVNLIGEHVDYCGYSVLPMAVEHDICIGIRTRPDNEINISNVNSFYNDYSTKIDSIQINASKPTWHNYVLCGIKGVFEASKSSEHRGMDMLVHGVVPQNAGLSSSSALVCAAGLATSHANKCNFTKLELAEICMKCEHYIGTIGGGMDQSISFLAKKSIAKLISFSPIRSVDVSLPTEAVFVVAHSCDELNKAASSHYNKRVAECKISVQILARESGLKFMEVSTFRELQEKLEFSFAQLLDLINSRLHKEAYSKEEAIKCLDIDEKTFSSNLLTRNTLTEKSFKLYKRSKHVITEAQRVWEFKDICASGSVDKIKMLGERMNESHLSCSVDYECSCSALDKLTKICRDSGAYGSRLTGAGWGGCCVSIVDKSKVKTFIQSVQETYYDENKLSGRKIEEVLFATEPGSGAIVFTV